MDIGLGGEVVHRVVQGRQEYLIIGKRAGETEVRVTFDSDEPWEQVQKRIEKCMRAARYAEEIQRGAVALPKLEGD